MIATAHAAERHGRDAPDLDFAVWAEQEAARRGVPLGRLGIAEEAAAAVCLLASAIASYITGACLDVSSGLGRGW